jgi:hypothetical protein
VTLVFRFLLFPLSLLGTVSAGGPGLRSRTRPLPADPREYAELEETQNSRGPGRTGGGPGPQRGRVPRWVKWSVIVVVLGLIFRRAMAWLALTALSGALHLVGIDVHLPHIRFGWPWQSITSGTTTNIDVGPWVLQKIEGISKPALGQENFNFVFTHKVSKSIAFWPCWYQATFYAVGRASATVNLNPGPTWWKPSTGHYRLTVLSRPASGQPGTVAVTMVLPQPQLPQSVHDVSIDNIPSRPLAVQHSWTYPGLACGTVIHPQFPQSVLYAQAQRIAFYRASQVSQVTRPLIKAAETEAVQTVRNNFVQPTVNALGYTLTRFAIQWASPAPDAGGQRSG